MQYSVSVNARRFSGLIRILCVFGLLFIGKGAWAASWQWSSLPGRERVEVLFDAPSPNSSAVRTGSTEIVLELGQSAASFARSGGRSGSLITGVAPSGNSLVVALRDAAFGYVVSRPDPRRLRVDVFPDPLGARWQGTRRTPETPATAVPPAPPVSPAASPAVVPPSAPAQPSPRAQEKTPAPSPATAAVPAHHESPRPQERTPAAVPPARTAPAQTLSAAQDPPAAAPRKENTSKMSQAPDSAIPSETARRAAPDKGRTDSVARSQTVLPPASETAQLAPEQSVPSGQNESDDGRGYISGNTLRGKLNHGGPDTWPEEQGLNSQALKSSAAAEASPNAPLPGEEERYSAQTAQRPEPSSPLPEEDRTVATAEAHPETTEQASEEHPVIYVDAEGNEVPKPPDVPTLLEEARKLVNTLQFAEARDKLEELKACVLTPEQREEVLYLLSDALDGLYKGRPLEGYEPVTAATSVAMNFNLESPRVPRALYRLGKLNLEADNQQEAIGYFGALRRKYPTDPDVPTAYVELGRDQLNKQQYADAVRSFQSVLDDYPESKEVRDASRYMAEALYRQGHYDRAQILVDFVDRRWPRIYLEDPLYLPMVADIHEKSGHNDQALQTYWTYYNLLPDNPDNDKNLLAIGTLYLRMGLKKGARDVFEELLRKFPQSASAPIAVLRMGEEEVNDGNPTLDALFALFNRPGSASPEAAYRRILASYPDSPQAEVAAIRLAAMRYWNKDTDEAMQAAAAFLDEHPVSPYAPRAEEIIVRGFRRELALALEEQNYERILSLWERFPQIPSAYPNPDDDLRVALGRAHLNRGNEQTGLDLLAGFLDRPEAGKYGEYVYNLFLAKDLREENWNAILNLGDKVASWKLPDTTRDQLDYSLAISAENLGLAERALEIWKKLYRKKDIPLYQRAYAAYFLARDAERRRNIQEAYDLNLETLNLFTQLQDERSDKADPERVRESLAALMDVTEVADRFPEALDWSQKYAEFVPDGSPDYAALLFRRARLHRKMGDLARWRSLLEQIVSAEPDSVFGRMAASELHTQQVARDITRFAPTEEPTP